MFSRSLSILAILATIGLSALPGHANAQSLIKRVKCADAADSPGIGVFRNASNYITNVTVQIVRDGCRPNGQHGAFGMHVTNYDGSARYENWRMEREHGHTWAVRDRVDPGRVVRISFSSPGGQKVHGTFDYMMIVD